MRARWLPVGLVALGIFALNVVARVVTKQFDIADPDDQVRLGLAGTAAVAVMLAAVTARWAVRHPVGRVVADLGAAVGIGTALALLLGPFTAGSRPFVEGPGAFVGEVLLFLGVAAVGLLLGYWIVVALGKDWKSRGLRNYEQNYHRRPRKTVRG
jgi:MFS family permease